MRAARSHSGSRRDPAPAPKPVPAVATFNITDAPETWLSMPQVCAMFGGVSRMWIHRRQLDAGFPRGIHLGGGKLVFFKLSEVQAWALASQHPAPVCNAPGSTS